MSKSKQQYMDELEYLQWQRTGITNSINDIKECLNRCDERDAEFHQQQLEQQEQDMNHE